MHIEVNCPHCKKMIALLNADVVDIPATLHQVSISGDTRTAAMFTAWVSGRVYSSDLCHNLDDPQLEGKSGWVYPDGTWIINHGNTFSTMAETQEIESTNLEKTEMWLWNHFSRFGKDAGEVCK